MYKDKKKTSESKKETKDEVKIEQAEENYFFPKEGITIKATSLEVAKEKLAQRKEKDDEAER